MVKISKIILLFFLLSLFLTSPITVISVSSQSPKDWWDSSWSYHQALILPINTDDTHAIFQPIDIRVTFENPCWVKDQNQHSIRVGVWKHDSWEILESQIYDFNISADQTITSCSVVFLIPEKANGDEQYYIFYDDTEKQAPDYPDHLSISEQKYYYEPIPGQSVDVSYYKITDDGKCVYGVGIEGKMMTEYASNLIFRQRANFSDFSVKTWDQLIGFCFQYENKARDVFTTRYQPLSNEVFVDGNLMIAFGIESISQDNSMKTRNIYKYFHNPSDSKRLCVDSTSEITNAIQIEDSVERDGTFVFLSAFKTRSESNIAMNMGEILPFFHLYSGKNIIETYQVNPNPTARQEHKIIELQDNQDIGAHAWFSMDSGEQGKSHGIIFSKETGIVLAGPNEQDGIQVKAYEMEEASLPGLTAYSAGIYCGRNSVNQQGTWDSQIPGMYRFELRGEAFTTETEGYEAIDTESQFFQRLIAERPMFGGTVKEREKETRYTLTVFVPLSLSLPLLSPISPFPLPITWVELYQDNVLVSAGATHRTLRGMTVTFPDVPNGTYLVKVMKRLGNTSRFVAFKEVEIRSDSRVILFCHRQVKLTCTIVDQENKAISSARFILSSGMSIIDAKNTNQKGICIFQVPSESDYTLNILFKEINVSTEKLSLFRSKKLTFKVPLYDLTVRVKDTFDLPPAVHISPVLTSDAMINPSMILPDASSESSFEFTNLPESHYNIQINYQGFTDEKIVQIPQDGNDITLTFSAVFTISSSIFDTYGNALNDRLVVLQRQAKTTEATTNQTGMSIDQVPPGEYQLSVYHNQKKTFTTKITIVGDATVFFITNEEPLYPSIITLLTGIGISLCIVLFLLKRITSNALMQFVSILCVCLALVQPWWMLTGHANEPFVERWSYAYLIPPTIISSTTAGEYIDAAPANLPPEFAGFLLGVLVISILALLLIILGGTKQKRKRLSLGLRIISILLLFCGIGVFSYGMSQLTTVGLGGLFGSGSLSVLQPGSTEYVTIVSSWGFGTGAYLVLLAISLLCSNEIFQRIYHKK